MQGFGVRIRQAMLDLSSRLGRRLTLADFGAMVGRAETGRRKAYSATGVSEWLQERSEPSLAAFRAMSKVTGHSEAWLAAFTDRDARYEGALEEVRPADPLPRDLRKKVEDVAEVRPKRRRVRGE